MKAKSPKKQKGLRLIVILAVFILALVLFFCFIPKILVNNNLRFLTASLATLVEQGVNLPIRLKIPKLGIDASIESIGRTQKGEVGVPKGPDDVAWFNQGPRPGEIGSAIISGHYGWKDDKPAVFDNLAKLKKGDKLFVVDNQGATTTFVVSKSQRYRSDSNALKVFSSNDGQAHLNLITCEGAWDKISKTYADRLVVFADIAH